MDIDFFCLFDAELKSSGLTLRMRYDPEGLPFESRLLE